MSTGLRERQEECTKKAFFLRVAAFNVQKRVLIRQSGLSVQHTTSKANTVTSLIGRRSFGRHESLNLGMKSLIKKILANFGYTISKQSPPNLASYIDFAAESLQKKRFYNVGAGIFSHPYWTNIDYASDHYAQYQSKAPFINCNLLDLTPIPVDSASAEAVYTSHTIEHVTDDAVDNLFSEAYRILKAGGIFRITCPDAELDYNAYKRGDHQWFSYCDDYSFVGTDEENKSLEQRFLHHITSQLCNVDQDTSAEMKFSSLQIREIFESRPLPEALQFFSAKARFNSDYPANHINWWTYDKVKAFLQRGGFSQIHRSGYKQSVCQALRDTRFFDNTHPEFSLYVEAIR
jgi:predicted SAM-dependent methyltransferase